MGHQIQPAEEEQERQLIAMDKVWYVYILECGDGSLYTGVTDDVRKRLEAHRAGKGAKYTRGRAPLTLRYQEMAESRAAAQHREYEIKQLSRSEKLKLCSLSPVKDR